MWRSLVWAARAISICSHSDPVFPGPPKGWVEGLSVWGLGVQGLGVRADLEIFAEIYGFIRTLCGFGFGVLRLGFGMPSVL